MNICPQCGSPIVFVGYTALHLPLYRCPTCFHAFVLIAGQRCTVLKGASNGHSHP